MKNDKAITLIIVVMTVILLGIIAGLIVTNGVATFENAKIIKFETNLKIIQKKVDMIIEDEIDYMQLGSELTQIQKTRLHTIIDNDSDNNFIQTDNIDEVKLRYFSSSDIKTIFDIEDVQDEFIINFANREVISLKGIEKNSIMHYVENGLH